MSLINQDLIQDNPQNGFGIYLNQVVQEMKRLQADVTGKLSADQISAMVKQKWDQMNINEKLPFEQLANQNKNPDQAPPPPPTPAQGPIYPSQLQQAQYMNPMDQMIKSQGIPVMSFKNMAGQGQGYTDGYQDQYGQGQVQTPQQLAMQAKKIAMPSRPGVPVSPDILPSSYPTGYSPLNESMDTVQRNMHARVLFSRHLRIILKNGYQNQLTDERINKILAACWERLGTAKELYENFARQKYYLDDVRGIRETQKQRVKGNPQGMVMMPNSMNSQGMDVSVGGVRGGQILQPNPLQPQQVLQPTRPQKSTTIPGVPTAVISNIEKQGLEMRQMMDNMPHSNPIINLPTKYAIVPVINNSFIDQQPITYLSPDQLQQVSGFLLMLDTNPEVINQIKHQSITKHDDKVKEETDYQSKS